MHSAIDTFTTGLHLHIIACKLLLNYDLVRLVTGHCQPQPAYSWLIAAGCLRNSVPKCIADEEIAPTQAGIT